MSNDNLISVKHLYRRYAGLTAVNDVSFELARGEVLGFLGPNGAGKTSTMQMLTGNLAPSSGRILINGIDLLDNPKQAKALIGYLPEQPPLYRELTVDEYLQFCARLNRIRRNAVSQAVERAKQRCGLEQVGRRLINNLSKGYQQRVGIAQAIIHSPPVVVLDEPTVGLDPIQIREIRRLIRELGEDHGVILSTHILPEVQMTCDRVQIINRGHLVFSDNIENLNRRRDSSSLILGLHQPPAETELAALPAITEVQALDNHRFRLFHASEQTPAEAIAEQAVAKSWGLFELSPEYKTLEQIFVEITSSEQAIAEGHAA
ncbi:ABC transporter ATP-binding protein [Thiohalophilus sp.]|uniref:ABC transporter ATP-binding protein n=1 Tax=Thiohalophilus sp. TaxID=3028392 RepID=UPI002ACE6340|nr:ATP-binding cassette domain-containing protein [Thiohalophilus sp.]MDZ7803722.1 ATP-binding cassette domain-containing protein [Thiohalophilus sp.]